MQCPTCGKAELEQTIVAKQLDCRRLNKRYTGITVVVPDWIEKKCPQCGESLFGGKTNFQRWRELAEAELKKRSNNVI